MPVECIVHASAVTEERLDTMWPGEAAGLSPGSPFLIEFEIGTFRDCIFIAAIGLELSKSILKREHQARWRAVLSKFNALR